MNSQCDRAQDSLRRGLKANHTPLAGSPALPASEDGFQPMPSVTIRPAGDSHLPSANTCISRLYIPLYSSKAILRYV